MKLLHNTELLYSIVTETKCVLCYMFFVGYKVKTEKLSKDTYNNFKIYLQRPGYKICNYFDSNIIRHIKLVIS